MNLLTNFFNPKSVWAKGIFAVFAFSVFFITTAYLLNYQTSEQRLLQRIEKEVPLTAEEKTMVSQKLQELSKDSDSDGLKDWEEIIYRTDAQNADTDGDGTKDGEEIKQNRNPLVKGPKDSNATPANEAMGENNPELENNLTYDFMKKLYSTVGPSLSPDGSIDNKALESFASEITWADPKSATGVLPAPFTKTALVVSTQNDAVAVKKYFNSLYEIYVSTVSVLKEDDFSILTRVLEEKNFDELKKLDSVINANDKIIAGIKKIPVPAGFEDFALRELNFLAQTKYLIENFKSAESDPLKVLTALQTRAKILQDIVNFREQTGKELVQKGIKFNPEEGGFALLLIQ